MTDLATWLTVVIATIGLALNYYLFRRQTVSKSLGLALVTNRSLVTAGTRFPISVSFADAILAAPRLVALAFANLGNATVEQTDFNTPLVIKFARAKVFAAQLSRSRPSDHTTAIRHDDTTVTVDPCLMNPGDLIEIQCLLDGPLGFDDVSVSARISGVSVIPVMRVPRTSWDEPYLVRKAESIITGLVLLSLGGVAVAPAWAWPPQAATYIAFAVVISIVPWLIRRSLQRDRKSRLFLG